MNLPQRVALALSQICENNDVLAAKLGVNKNTISAYKNCKGDLKGIVIEGLSKQYNFSPVWLLTGEGEPNLSDIKTKNKTAIDIQHSNIIERFKNKPLAKDINQDLLDIEDANPGALEKISAYIKGIAEGMRLAHGGGGVATADRRKCERRNGDVESELEYEGEERRTGVDRRDIAGS